MIDGQSQRELERRVRLYDQLATMHALMHDRNASLASWTDLGIVVLSVAVSGLTFADSTVLDAIGVAGIGGRILLGGVALTLFAASLVAWKVDWKAAADRHGHAVSTLADLKAQARALLAADPVDESERERFFRSAEAVVGTLAKIPEAKFLSLKRAHVAKVAISRLLDRHPGAFVWWMRLQLWLRDNRKVTSAIQSASDDQK
jgi:hypothetical protein